MRERRPKTDLSGQIFGLLTVNSYLGESRWSCTCSEHPDKIFVTTTQNLKSGDTKSCGCLKIKLTSERFKTHGMSKSREYRIWRLLRDRCYNPKSKYFKDYGGRGITVCDEWNSSFELFIYDMGKSPSDKHSIDRIDNEKGYCKENCRWATKLEQANNCRSNRPLTFNGKTQNVSEWAEELGYKAITLYERLNRGWSVEKTLTTPAIKTRDYERKH